MVAGLVPSSLGSTGARVRSLERILAEESLSDVAVLVDLVCPFVAVNERAVQCLSFLRGFLAEIRRAG